MVWSHIQDSPGGNAISSAASATSLNLPAFGSPLTIGDLLLVFGFGTNTTTQPTLTDNAVIPNSYVNIADAGIFAPSTSWCHIWLGQIVNNPSSGNLIVTLSTATSQNLYGCAAQFRGGTPIADFDLINTSGAGAGGASNNYGQASDGTTSIAPIERPTSRSIITSQPNDLLLACVQSPTAISASPSGWTSIGADGNRQAIYRMQNGMAIIGGTLTGQAILSGNNPWTIGSTSGGPYFAMTFQALRQLVPPIYFQPAHWWGGGIGQAHAVD